MGERLGHPEAIALGKAVETRTLRVGEGPMPVLFRGSGEKLAFEEQTPL